MACAWFLNLHKFLIYSEEMWHLDGLIHVRPDVLDRLGLQRGDLYSSYHKICASFFVQVTGLAQKHANIQTPTTEIIESLINKNMKSSEINWPKKNPTAQCDQQYKTMPAYCTCVSLVCVWDPVVSCAVGGGHVCITWKTVSFFNCPADRLAFIIS